MSRSNYVHAAHLARKIALISCVCVAAAALFSSDVAHAQAASASGAFALSSPRSSGFALSSPRDPDRSVRRDTDDDDDRPRMDSIGLGVNLGVAVTGAGSATVQGYEGRTERRVGLHLGVPIYLGGSGFGWVFEPMLQRSSVVHSTKDTLGNVTGSEEVNVLGLGGYTGPLVQIRATNALYFGIGFGAKFLVLKNDAFQYAYDLYGRIPLSTTYYVSRHLALCAELGLGYGASVFADQPRITGTASSGAVTVKNAADDPQFGKAFAWDLSFGVRLP